MDQFFAGSTAAPLCGPDCTWRVTAAVCAATEWRSAWCCGLSARLSGAELRTFAQRHKEGFRSPPRYFDENLMILMLICWIFNKSEPLVIIFNMFKLLCDWQIPSIFQKNSSKMFQLYDMIFKNFNNILSNANLQKKSWTLMNFFYIQLKILFLALWPSSSKLFCHVFWCSQVGKVLVL